MGDKSPKNKEKMKKNRKRVLIMVLVLNFGILIFLKYFNLFGSNYVLTSVLLCVVFPIIIYVLLIYEIHLIN